jgi:TolB protein
VTPCDRRRRFQWTNLCILALVIGLPTMTAQAPPPAVGRFEGHADLGTVLHPGAAAFDASTQAYTVSGSGENVWGAADAFHFVWSTVEGDVAIEADITFVGTGTNAHRKAMLMIRQGLEADAPYVDAAVHGDGLTSIQFRAEKGGPTQEVQSNVAGPTRVRIERQGDYARLYVAESRPGPPQSQPQPQSTSQPQLQPLRFSGGAARVAFTGTLYVGLGVCSHEKDEVVTARFSNVTVQPLTASAKPPVLYSTLETVPLGTGSTDRRVQYVSTTRFEAPNWYPDGKAWLVNSGGKLLKIPMGGGAVETVNTGTRTRNNNDHGISKDGSTIIISDQSEGANGERGGPSRIYTVPIAGGEPKLVTPNAPSYWHGISPDGTTLAYCAQRNDEFDVYTIPVGGGAETRLTTATGLDDGPEYSPDGQWIYFNSVRSGLMQIWKMKPDGSEQTPVTSDAFNNWFAHPSPDGRFLVFLSYDKSVSGHPANQDVRLRRMTLATGEIATAARFFGGQGTQNVPNWSPDGRQVAFVTYQLVPER